MRLNSGFHTAVRVATVPFPDAVKVIAFPTAFAVVMPNSKSIAHVMYMCFYLRNLPFLFCSCVFLPYFLGLRHHLMFKNQNVTWCFLSSICSLVMWRPHWMLLPVFLFWVLASVIVCWSFYHDCQRHSPSSPFPLLANSASLLWWPFSLFLSQMGSASLFILRFHNKSAWQRCLDYFQVCNIFRFFLVWICGLEWDGYTC